MVYNLCLHYLHVSADAEEAAQDIFVKIHQRIESFEGKSTVKTWVYRITVNHCLDVLKSKKRRSWLMSLQSLFSEQKEMPAPVSFEHPQVQMEQKESVERLYQHIYNLPEKQKTALLLKAVEQLSQKEIADVMEMSEKAVESLLSRARVGLKKSLGNTEG